MHNDNENNTRLNVRIPRALRIEFKKLCVEKDLYMEDVVRALIESFVSREQENEKL